MLKRIFGCAFALFLAPAAASAQIAGMDEVAGAAEGAPVRVIITLGGEATLDGADALKSRKEALMSDVFGTALDAKNTIPDTPYIVTDITKAQLNALKTTYGVKAVQIDKPEPFNLSKSTGIIGAPAVWSKGSHGAGQNIAVLDTGVLSSHPFIKVTAEACFSSNVPSQGAKSACPNGKVMQVGPGAGAPCAAPGCNHGTHVAGIAAGNGVRFSGVAPDAGIIAVQVFSVFRDKAGGPSVCASAGVRSPCSLAYVSDQLRALAHIRNLAKSMPIAAVNMSLGGGKQTGYCRSDVRTAEIARLRAMGVAVVISSGNSGFSDAVGAPGCVDPAITVGSTTKGDKLSNFSNSASMVDVLAPGSQILSSVLGDGFASMSGTSMAAPHVAGAIAVLKACKPDLTVDQIESALKNSGAMITDPRNNIARSRINLAAASKVCAGGEKAIWE